MKKRKRAGCGIGADRAPGRFWRESGDCRVHERGTPRRKSVSLLAADGEWDARNKLTPRLDKPWQKIADSLLRVGPWRRESLIWSDTGLCFPNKLFIFVYGRIVSKKSR